MKKIKENLNEILLAYYIFSFILLGRIIPKYTEVSEIVLILNLLIVLFISIIYNRNQLKFTMPELMIYLIIILYSIIDYNFRINEFTVHIYIYMIIFAMVPIFLYARITNMKDFIKAYSFFSILVAVLYILDPFKKYKYSGDYMGFGYNVMMLAYIGIYISVRSKKRLWTKLLLLIILIEVFMFANKGAILSIGLFSLMYELFIKKGRLKNVLIIIVVTVILLGSGVIIEEVHNIALKNNLHSYSIETLYQMSKKTSTGLSGREKIWANAQEQIRENFWFGNGAGYYQAENTEGLYSHNIIYDIILEYGIIVFAFIFILIIKGIIKIKREKDNDRLLGIAFLIMWFPKLFLSSYFQANMGFWLFLIWALLNNKEVQGVKDESKKFNY